MTILIENALVVAMDGPGTVLENGWVRIEGSSIAALGPMPAPRGGFDRRVDARGGILMPGFVNVHTHVSMAPFRGLGEDRPDRLRRFLFPLEKRFVTGELVYDGARFGLIEMAKSGTTCFADMYYFEAEVARAADEAGLRAVLGETIVDFPAPDAAEPYGGLEYARRFASDWSGHPRVSPSFAPHAPYTVDAEHLRTASDEADRRGLVLQMHVAEAADENARFTASHGSTLRYLDSIGVLTPRLLAAHLVYVDEADIALLAERDAAAAHCPQSNAKAGRPIAPAQRMAAAGVRLGLATDGPLSGNGMDMQSVVSWYPKMQKVRELKRDLTTAKEAAYAATIGGARALGMGDLIGSIEPGKRADLALFDVDSFGIQPIHDAYSTIVYALKASDARSVLADGAFVVDERRMVGIDEGAAMAKLKETAERVKAAAADL
jgi:cytosine/adenosine deaminase-related metal-dependent hydrolase